MWRVSSTQVNKEITKYSRYIHGLWHDPWSFCFSLFCMRKGIVDIQRLLPSKSFIIHVSLTSNDFMFVHVLRWYSVFFQIYISLVLHKGFIHYKITLDSLKGLLLLLSVKFVLFVIHVYAPILGRWTTFIPYHRVIPLLPLFSFIYVYGFVICDTYSVSQ